MLDFSFYAPTYFAFGEGQETRCGELVRRFGGSKVLLHYGVGSIKRNGVYDAVTKSLKDAGIAFVELGGVQPNPRSSLVYEGIDICRREKVDFVLAVGGGSTIDSAKAIAAGVPYDGDFWDFFSKKGTVTATLPVGTVLTIPAAGSEGSPNAVITKDEGSYKWSCPAVDIMRPVFAIMNPRYTCTLPPYQTAAGITDIMVHILERYFTNTPDVDVTDRLCEALLLTIIRAGHRVINNPNDLAARADIMWAGMLAHNNSCGVGREQDWSSHNIEHELSALYDVTHGAGLAVVMPAWMDFAYSHDIDRFVQFAVRVWGCQRDPQNPENTAKEGIARFRAFLKAIGMPLTLGELGADPADIPKMVERRKLVGLPMGSFVSLGEKEMAAILELAR
jgi:alcohol dehydrogenase YqhD (iron-dependent ADH family)